MENIEVPKQRQEKNTSEIKYEETQMNKSHKNETSTQQGNKNDNIPKSKQDDPKRSDKGNNGRNSRNNNYQSSQQKQTNKNNNELDEPQKMNHQPDTKDSKKQMKSLIEPKGYKNQTVETNEFKSLPKNEPTRNETLKTNNEANKQAHGGLLKVNQSTLNELLAQNEREHNAQLKETLAESKRDQDTSRSNLESNRQSSPNVKMLFDPNNPNKPILIQQKLNSDSFSHKSTSNEHQ